MDSAAATALARRVFGARIAQRTEGAQTVVRAAGGARRYLDDFTVAPRGGGRLLVSSVPLRHRALSGRTVPTDLRLRARGDVFVPRSAPVDVSIAARLAGGVEVDGTRVRFDGVDGANPAARELGANSVIYPRIATDTDAVAATTTRGAELFTILRSPRSPERQRLVVDVPAGGRLRAAPDGSAQVESADGTTSLTISAPEAEDAKGRQVPVQMSPASDGRTLVLDVPHRGRGVAYPLLVDPVVSPWLDGSGNGWWFSGHREGLERWLVADGHGTGAPFAPRSTCYTPISCYAQDGLYIYAYGGWTYSAGANTGFTTSLPADRTAYFKSVRFTNTYFNRRGDPAPAPFLAAGILDMTAGGWTGLTTTNGNLTNATLTIPATMGTIAHGKSLFFGMFVDAVRTLPNWEEAYTGGVVMEVEDPEAPTIAGVAGAGGPGQGGWVRGTTSITPTATDPGLGIWQYAIAIPGLLTPSGGSVGYAHGCTGRVDDLCPTSYSRTIEWSTASMPNGSNQIALWAYDPSQHLSAPTTWSLKVDNEQPSFSLSGTLADARNGDLVPGSSTTAALHVSATDGDATHLRSGVRSIGIAVDGDIVTTDQTCAAQQSNCALAADRTIQLAGLQPGPHTVAVTITDRAGNVAQDSWQIGLYRTSWEYGGANHQVDTPQEIATLEAAIAVADASARAALHAGLTPADRVRLDISRDQASPEIYEINRPGYWVQDRNMLFDFGASDALSGIRTLRTASPTAPGWEGVGSSHMLNGCVSDPDVRCVGNAHVRSVVGNLPSGRNVVEVTAIDAAGNPTVRQFHVLVDTDDPQIYEINRPGHWVNDPNLFFDFGASDDASGIKVLRTFSPSFSGWEGVGNSHMLNDCGDGIAVQCVGNAHVRSVVGNLPSGLQTIEVVATDAAGRELHRQFHLPVDKDEPTASISGSLWSSAATGLTGGDLQVAADDGHSGVTSIQLYERLADGSRQGLAGVNRTDAQCPGYGCTPRNMTLSANISLATLGWGAHRFEVDVWDRAGNLKTIGWTAAPPELDKRSFVISSSSAPETYRWTPAVPAGFHLGLAASGREVVVRNAANQQVGVLATVYVSDGEHGVVDMRYRLDGADVLIDVPHRSSTVAYPLVVDTNVDRWDATQDAGIVDAMEEGDEPADVGTPDDYEPLPEGEELNLAAAATASAAGYNRNEYEREWCEDNNWFCIEFLLDSKKARKLTKYLFGTDRDGTRANAFMHAFWTGMMVTSAAKAGGGYRGKAMEYAVHHERTDQESPDAEVRARSDMDLHNNTRGFTYAYSHYTVTDETMCNSMLNRVANSVYRPVGSDPSTWPSSPVYLYKGVARKDGHGCGPA